MKKRFFLFLSLCLFSIEFLICQAPYIEDGPGTGLGQYGYLEHDAVTFATVNRNTWDNIWTLAARWWVGTEYIYFSNDNWMCSGGNQQSGITANFNPSHFGANWIPGASAYVSVNSYFCGSGQDLHLNERHFDILDIGHAVHPSISESILDGDGICSTDNVAGSFTINPGALTGKTLERLYLYNAGTAQEGTHIPNDGFTVFYEAVTGTEVFDGNESSFKIYGDWGGNPGSNNEYGAENLGVSLNGEIRFYVVLCDLVDGAGGASIDLFISNDGISFGPALNNHSLLRIDATGITNAPITLPLQIVEFLVEKKDHQVFLHCQIECNLLSDYTLTFEKCLDLREWIPLSNSRIEVTGEFIRKYSSLDQLKTPGIHYYRFRITDPDGAELFSPVRQVVNEETIQIYPNPAGEILYFDGLDRPGVTYRYELFDLTGKMISKGDLNQCLLLGEWKVPKNDWYVIRILANEQELENRLVFIQP